MKLKKIITILTIIFLFCNTICFADINTDNFKPGDITSKDYDSAFDMAAKIAGGLITVGIVVAIVGIMVLGIKYMMGSVEQKAEYKKTMIPYIVGCIFLFATGTIVSIIYKLASQL